MYILSVFTFEDLLFECRTLHLGRFYKLTLDCLWQILQQIFAKRRRSIASYDSSL